MPEYKYQPESGNVTSTLSVFEVYDPDTNTISNKKILKGESFYSDRYGCGLHTYEYGYDDAPADHHLHALQDSSVCAG